MATHTVAQSHIFFYREMVTLGGGVFRGVQQGDPSIGLSALILFDGPSKSTLALKAEEISARRVREHIAQKEAEFEAFAEKACTRVFSQFVRKAA